MNTIIPNNAVQENHLQSLISSFFKEFQIGKVLERSNGGKEKGISSADVFKLIFSLVFTGKTFLRFLQTQADSQTGAKDTVYRFLNSSRTNWRKFLFLLSSRVVSTLQPLTSRDRVDVLIVDDSLYSRARSKTVELLAKVYDHVDHRFVKGFRMLTLGWSDGNSFVPLAFSLLSSEKKKNRLVDISSRIDKRCNGYKRRVEAMGKATDVLIRLLQQAKDYGFTAKYVLFDSWFAFPTILVKVAGVGFHPVAMVKNTPKIFYGFNGKFATLSTIYSAVRKKRGKAKILSSTLVQLNQANDANSVSAKIVFVRDRNRSRQWLALITTDITLTDEEVVRLYGKRWDIEVFFKTLKSYLKLGKEFQGRVYDSMVAHTTIVFTRYILLSLERRRNKDDRTLGGIFYDCCDELEDIRFSAALQLLMNLIVGIFSEATTVTKEQVAALFHQFIDGLPSRIKVQRRFLVCET